MLQLISIALLIIEPIKTIRELLCIKFGLLYLPLLDGLQVDFVLEPLCTPPLFSEFLTVLV